MMTIRTNTRLALRALAVLIVMLFTTTAWADDVTYQAYNTTKAFESVTHDATAVASTTTTMGTADTETWYVVSSDVTISSRIEVVGTVHLILCDGKTLTAPKGLHVPSGVTLIIYGQSGDTGKLTISNVANSQAGIGGNENGNGGSVTIHGGSITTTGGYFSAGIGGGKNGNGGDVTIYGGSVTTTGGNYGAGIGGGYYGNGGDVTINGGTVNATGKYGGAGIGGGYSGNGGNSLVISGGTVNATGGDSDNYSGAGIGGGNNNAGYTSVTITGGTVIAKGANDAQAIGRGDGSASSGSLTLGDMKVFASADATVPVVPANRESTCRTAYAKIDHCAPHDWATHSCTYCGAIYKGVIYNANGATDGTVPAAATEYGEGQTVTVLGIGDLVHSGYQQFAGWNTQADGKGTNYTEGNTFTFTEPVTLYANWQGPITYTVRFNKNNDDATGTMADQTFTYDVAKNLPNCTFSYSGHTFIGWSTTNDGAVVYNDGASAINLAASQDDIADLYAVWIEIPYLSYNTTTQSFDEVTPTALSVVASNTTTMGTANTETWYAVCENVTVSNRIEIAGTVHLILADGKTLTASKGLHVPSGVTLNIYGQTNGTGKIAISGVDRNRAGIGGNKNENGGSLTIHGGNITTTGGYYGAGIGGGYNGNGGASIVIFGGTVTAKGGYEAAGIGGGYWANGGASVVISGGTVTANGGDYAAGIGGGYGKGGCTSVNITGGKVIAEGKNTAQAIGRGYGAESSGGLTLGDMKVFASANATDPVAPADRVGICRSSYAKIMLCDPHNWPTHLCTYCGATFQGVIYNDNNATDGTVPASTAYTDGQTVTVLGNTGNLVRTGYTFGGWNTQADGQGTDHAPNATFDFTEPITLYAKWTPIKYKVCFHKNNDDATGEMNDQTFTYDVEQALTLNAFTRTDYDISGWSTTENGEIVYSNGQSVINLASTQGYVIDLYAQWKHVLSLASDADNSEVISQAASADVFDEVTLDGYTLYRDGSWNTLYLPFDVSDFTDTPLDGAIVKALESTDYDNGTLTMTFEDATSIEAGTPYAVKWDADLIIRSAADWNAFVSSVNATDSYKDKVVKLAADITVSTTVGDGSVDGNGHATPTKSFCGTFDGSGHTLTFNNTTNLRGKAPFRYVTGATIQNLTIAGSSTSSGKELAGLIAYSLGEVTISNCVLSATLTSNFSGNSSNGGFIARVQNGSVTFNNCLFSGKLLGSSASSCGGFVGWRNGSPALYFNNSLFDPAQVTMSSSDSRTFRRGDNGTCNFNNTYYKTKFGNAQGTEATATGSALQALLGNGWKVSGNNVVPKMKNTVNDTTNPVFTNVTISDATVTADDDTYFIGSYAPFNNSSLLFDTNNPDGDALHAAISLIPDDAEEGYVFGGWCADADKTEAVTGIPFAADGSVTLYAKYTPILFAAGATNEWMTWCGDEAYKVPTGCTAYEVVGIDGTNVTLNPLTTIPAYTPVLIQRTAGTLTKDIAAPFISVGTAPESWYDDEVGLVATSVTGCSFIGNATGTAIGTGYIAAGSSYALYGNRFVRIEVDNGIPAHRCVLTPSVAGARQLNIVIGDSTTEITTTDFKDYTDKPDTWYDLQGRRLDKQPTRKGVYIYNNMVRVVK